MMALDIGSKRTGVAVADDLGAMAHIRPALKHGSVKELVAAVREAVEAEGVTEVVVGVPIGLSGNATAQTEEVLAVIGALRASLGVPVTQWDERLSSREAERVVPRQERRTGGLDSQAAAIVLQAVIDSRRAAAR